MKPRLYLSENLLNEQSIKSVWLKDAHQSIQLQQQHQQHKILPLLAVVL